MDIIKHCLVCGKEFKACNTCQTNVPETLQWRRVVCSPAHFAFHIPIIMYHNKEYGKEQANIELLQAIERYGEIEFCDNVKKIVDEILADNKDEIVMENKSISDSAINFITDSSDSIIKPETKLKKSKQIKGE